MFNLNFSKFFSDFSMRKENTNLLIRTWKNQNKEAYAQFIRGIDKVTEGDLTLLYNMSFGAALRFKGSEWFCR